MTVHWTDGNTMFQTGLDRKAAFQPNGIFSKTQFLWGFSPSCRLCAERLGGVECCDSKQQQSLLRCPSRQGNTLLLWITNRDHRQPPVTGFFLTGSFSVFYSSFLKRDCCICLTFHGIWASLYIKLYVSSHCLFSPIGIIIFEIPQ